ncbi:hypothetical protein A9Q84_10520 [Halobacteriovorax marinus]|uniref:DUF4340 domain-containing protein n=1 Tax=Halobacteriovorax marinus TaxID=97084 RepID=A0A1Y5F780_9BACT|nr:hypothetical protein A9Q84_10520 [Halobacteriovorax marinus]
MLVKISTDRTKAANVLTFMFLIAIVLGGLASWLFQAPLTKNTALSRYQLLIKPEQIEQVKSIQLTNRLGVFTISKDNSKVWSLTEPRNLPSNQTTVQNILTNLSQIKIRKILSKDAINISNFSLDTPLMKLKLSYYGGKVHTLNLGLLNPFDNSTYVTFSEQEAIYHVDALKGNLESLNLSNFIESKIFTQKISDITHLKIYKGKLPATKARLNILRDKDDWVDANKKTLAPKAVESYLRNLLSLKSSLIIDKRSKKLDKALSKYFTNPSYTMEVAHKNGNKTFYEVTYLINTIPDLKMEKKQTFIIKSSNSPHPYIIEKDKMTLFHKSQRSFKKLSIKKLFY